MQTVALLLFALLIAMTEANAEVNGWYAGDERSPPPKNDGTYSAPYNALDHPGEYPIFYGADKAGWSCSYQKESGAIVQYGDSRTPQQQWLDVYGRGSDNDN